MQNFELSSELFAALIGVIITFTIAGIGYLISTYNDGRKWRRQKMAELYEETVRIQLKVKNADEELIKAATDLVRLRATGHTEQSSEVKQKSTEVRDANRLAMSHLEDLEYYSQRAAISGSHKAYAALNLFIQRNVEWFKEESAAYERGTPGIGTEELKEAKSDAWTDFLLQARRDLGFSTGEFPRVKFNFRRRSRR